MITATGKYRMGTLRGDSGREINFDIAIATRQQNVDVMEKFWWGGGGRFFPFWKKGV